MEEGRVVGGSEAHSTTANWWPAFGMLSGELLELSTQKEHMALPVIQETIWH